MLQNDNLTAEKHNAINFKLTYTEDINTDKNDRIIQKTIHEIKEIIITHIEIPKTDKNEITALIGDFEEPINSIKQELKEAMEET